MPQAERSAEKNLVAALKALAETLKGTLSASSAAEYRDLSGVYFFLSLDLVNSTKFKTDQPCKWPFRIRSFYDEALKEVKANFANFRAPHTQDDVFDGVTPKLWKYAGDEVLFFLRLESVPQATSCIDAAYKALEATRIAMENATTDEVTMLSVKGACWSAVVDYVAPTTLRDASAPIEAPNIMFVTELGGSGTSFDFLGPDIDAGFRTAASSVRGALVVGPDLAWFTRENGAPKQVLDNLRTVELKELKGVWGGRLYPIIWYHPDWESMRDKYEYDEPFRYPLLAKALETSTAPDLLTRAIEANGRKKIVNQMGPRLQPNPDKGAVVRVAAEPLVELHCAAICINSQGRVLLAKRPPSKKTLPGKWEFGCSQLRPGDTLTLAVERDYLTDFGIKVDLSPWPEPVPIATYTVKSVPQVSGIIIVAAYDGTDPIKVNLTKHTDAGWFDPANLPPDVIDNGVPNLCDQVERAVQVWRLARSR